MADDMKKKIFVVDDDVMNRKLSVDLLELHGMCAVTAQSGQELLQMLKTETPDLILMDINLPDMDGFELFKAVRAKEKSRSVKVIAWTALAMREEQEKIRAAGFDRCIIKPIETKKFVQEVRDLLAA
ncbi:MAG: response regulator [Candidatus Omnitrophica bacterium]|nr:response regulator [Candidatus Omnitrophota bacterium]